MVRTKVPALGVRRTLTGLSRVTVKATSESTGLDRDGTPTLGFWRGKTAS